MNSVNRVSLMGNLGSDPEKRFTQNGNSVTNFRMATNETWTDKDGNKQKRTEWHRVVVWGKLADVCAQYLNKGRQVYVEGRLQTRKWQDKDGNDRFTTEINAQTVNFIDSRKPAANQEQPAQQAEDTPVDTDDCPF